MKLDKKNKRWLVFDFKYSLILIFFFFTLKSFSQSCTLNIDNQTNVSCYGGYDGSLTLSGSGGAGAYFYSIQYYNSFFNMYFELAHSPDTGQYISYPATFMNIPANCYLITLEDSLGCVDSMNVCITQPDSIYSITDSTVCDYIIWNMNVHTLSGTYNTVLTAANGCDSSAILNLTVNYSDTNITYLTACDSAVWDGATYYTSGTYTNTYTNSNGCDSIEILNLTINNSSSSNFSIISCNSYTWDGITYISSGNFTNNYTNINGCDSIVTLDLTINSSDSLYVSYFSCDPYTWNGNTYTQSGIYTSIFTNVNGCDSIVILDLTIESNFGTTSYMTSCDSYTWLGNTYFVSGLYDSLLTNVNGCDSLVYLNLTINNSTSNNLNISSCDNYIWDGVTYNSSGTYTNIYNGLNGCDSTVTLNLIINTSSSDSVFVDACEDYIWNGIIYDSSGIYTNVFVNQNGCDSTIVLSLNIEDSDSSFTTVSACGNYFWNGINYTQSGVYYHSGTQNFNTYSLNFDGNNDYVEAPSISIYDTIRHNLTLSSWIKLDNSFSSNGSIIARRNFVGNPNGERHHFELTVLSDKSIAFSTANNQNNSLYTAQLQTATNVLSLNTWHYVSCSFENGNVLIYVDGQVVASQNFGYREMYPNSHWLNFGIVHRSGGNQFFNEFEGQITNVEIWARVLSQLEIQNNMICSPLADEQGLVGYWNFEEGSGNTVHDLTSNLNHGTTYNGTNFVIDAPIQSCQLINQNGCDSVAVLNLTITNIDTFYTSITACNNFDWDGITYDSSGIYSNIYTNTGGCDSLVFLDLTINYSDTSFTNIIACDSVEWNGTWYDTSGTYYSNNGSSNNYSMSFDGLNDHVEIADTSTLQVDEFTVIMDVYVENIGSEMALFTKLEDNADNEQFYCGINTLGQLHFGVKIGSSCIAGNGWQTFTSSLALSANQWYNLAYQYDQDKLKLYVDGILIGENDIVNDGPIDSCFGGSIRFGKNWNGGPNFFNGKIDNIQFWNFDLDINDIQTYISCNPIGNEIGLIGLWNFEEGNGNAALDQTSNSHDGVIYNAIYSSDVPVKSCQLYNSNGCDSIAVLNLVLNYSSSSTIYASSCDSYLWDGVSYDSSGLYSNLYSDVNGCDSLVTLNLTINQSDTSFLNISACDSYTIGDSTYTQSGIYHLNTISNNSYSLNFDGNGNYAELSNVISFGQNSFTISIDCYLNAFEGSDNETYSYIVGTPLVSSNNDHGFKIQTASTGLNGGFEAHINDAGTTHFNVISYNNSSQTNVVLNRWYNLSMVVDRVNNIFNFYVDGILVGSQVISSSFGDVDAGIPISLGHMSMNNTSLLDGLTDNLQIWGKPLSQQEIQNYILCPPLGNENDLIGFWNFDEGSGTTVFDLSTNNNNATIYGATYNNNIPSNACQLINSSGCDSTVVLDLTLFLSDTSITNLTVCDSLYWNDQWYDSSGTFYYNGNSVDSNITGFTYIGFYNGNNYYISNNPETKINAQNICLNNGGYLASVGDSSENSFIQNNFVNWSLNGNPVLIGLDYISNNNWIWDDGNLSYFFNWGPGEPSDTPNVAYVQMYSSGLWYDGSNATLSHYFLMEVPGRLLNFNGCDSTAVLNLIVNQSDSLLITSTSCDSYSWLGTIYTSSGIYDSLFTTVDGCDSLVVLDLTINNSDTTTSVVSSCDSYSWLGTTYTSSGIYDSLFTTVDGCDSLVVLDLILSYSFSNTINITTCDSYFWDGLAYDSSGFYTNTYTSLNGCDSTVILNLTVIESPNILQNDSSICFGDSIVLSYFNQSSFTPCNLPINLQTDLIGFYPFCGNANDESLFSNNGSVIGANLTDDRFGNTNSAYSFDGSNDYIDLGNPPPNPGSLTISTWVKTIEVISAQRWIVSRSNWTTGAWQLMTYDGYAATEFDWGGQLVGNTFIADGQWHHVLTIYDASNDYRYLYVDGVLDGIDSTRGPFSENGNQLLIGKRSGSSGTFNGDIDDVILYNRVLSLTEIQELYSNTSNVNNYLWSTGDSSSSIVVLPNQTTTYWLENNNNGISCRDSITITVNDTSLSYFNVVSCDSYQWDGTVYDSSGIYTNIYTSTNGCDSTVIIDLTINTSFNSTLVVSTCDSYQWDGILYDSSGTYTNIYSTTNGCDSIVNLDLTINSTYLYTDTVVTCDSYVFSFYNGLIYDSSGVYTDTLISSSGCDSIINLVLTVNYSDVNIDTVTSCFSYDWYGQTYYVSGIYDSLFTNSFGCDSIISINLTIVNNTSSLDTVQSCDSYLWNGITYYSSGNYDSLFTNSFGCDSLAMLFLTINNSDSSFTTVNSCDSFVWNGTTYDSSGIYYQNFGPQNNSSLNFNGQGDYVQIPDASINNLNSGTYMAWIKLNDNTSESILCKQSDGENTYSSLSVGYYVNQSGHGNPADAGRLYFHSQNSVPHASSVDLISNNTYTHVAVTFSQDSATFYIDGQFSGTTIGNYSIPNDLTVTYTRLGYYNVQGTYFMDGNIDEFSVWNRMLTQQEIQQFINCSPNGNESNLVSFWNMNEGVGITVNDISNNNYHGSTSGATWDLDIPSQNCQLFNTNGCDSVAVLDLTISNSSTSNISVVSCDSYIWDGIVYDSSGIFTNIYSDLNGCDSIVVLDLTINYSYSSSINITACDSYLWDGILYDSSGIYTNTYSNINGCDSIVTLNLNINNSSAFSFSDTVCGFYVWDGVTYDSSGTYSNLYSNIYGCDSVVTLDLIINNGSLTNLSINSCDSFIWNGTTYDSTGVYINQFIDANGCDSTVYLDLVINYSLLSSFNVNVCDSFIWDGVVYDSSGSYTNTYNSIYGCDSIVTLLLNLNTYSSIVDTHEICLGDSVVVANNVYYLAGSYLDTLNYVDGCDSLIINTLINLLPSGCTDPVAFNFDSLAQCDDNSCIMPIYGCLDSSAINYYAGANYDDGSCVYAGCTDSTASNFDPIATIDDGSCVYTLCLSPNPNGLFAINITDKQAEINWNNMNSIDCMVWKYYVRYREVGTNTWTTKSAGVGSGLCNIGLNTTSKILKNLNPSTTYEFKMKAFYCGGTESSYSIPAQFTTKGVCPEMANLTTQTFYFNPNKVRFNWDSTGQYVFARILLRVDSVGSSWQTAGGYGIYYPNLSVNKYGLQAGEFYRAQGRTFCDSNITSYRSWWTPPIFWQQPSQIRINGGIDISNLDIYPNPSKDLFNISFVSETKQNLSLRILNIIGEEIYLEDKFDYIGEYTKQINLEKYSQGVYFLEIETNNGIINKKIILQ